LFSEWDAVNHQHFGSATSSWPLPAPQNVSLELSNTSAIFSDRAGSVVLMTRGMVSQFKQLPSASTALGKMSASAYTNILFDVTSATAFGSAPYNPVQIVYTTANDAFGNPVNYYFACVQTNSDTNTTNIAHFVPVGSRTTTPPMPNSDTTDATVPVLVDGWGNPIIFVPGGVLGSGAALSAGPTPPAGYPIHGSGAIASNPGSNGLSIQARSPDGRPFWASAGPDGDFSAGDDNMYSFEK
jgi:hypothetical protein